MIELKASGRGGARYEIDVVTADPLTGAQCWAVRLDGVIVADVAEVVRFKGERVADLVARAHDAPLDSPHRHADLQRLNEFLQSR